MNVIRILLILGLVYVAMTQKSDKTRNMILIVTGLLAFCMFAKEGFDAITFTSGAGHDVTTGTATATAARGGTITSSVSQIPYVFAEDYNLADGTPSPTYACPDGHKGTAVITPTGHLSAATVGEAYPCVNTTACPAVASKPSPDQCGSGKTYKSTITAADTYTGTTGSTTYKTNCCTTESVAGQLCSAATTMKCGDYEKKKTGPADCAGAACVQNTDFTPTSGTGACCELNCEASDCDDSWSAILNMKHGKCGNSGLIFDDYCES